jgi:purine-binding chemotaxis protein CheW
VTLLNHLRLNHPRLNDPSDSLQHYLEELLGDGEYLDSTATTHFPEPLFVEADVAQKEKLQKLLHSAPIKIESDSIVPETKPSVLETKPSLLETESNAQKIDAEDPIDDVSIPGLEWLPNGLPSWAQTRFEVLLFQVSGLTLAVPLISLGQILPITDELTPIFGQADWFMGLQPTPSGKIRVVNTAKFVMPERYQDDFVKRAKYLVSINGVPWGLAVDSIHQPISLEPNAVKWRTNRSQRPWLAGTVKAHMCALLDIPMFGKLLMNVDKNRAKNPC